MRLPLPLFEFLLGCAVIGWGAWELFSLRRDRTLRANLEDAPADEPAKDESTT